MRRYGIIVSLIFCLFALVKPADAHPRHHHRIHVHRIVHAKHHVRFSRHWRGHRKGMERVSYGADPRPAAWCGYYLRHLLGVADRSFNLAANWAHWGHSAGGPRIGAVVVFPHHVGKIVGRTSNGEWIVNSGNDGHAVRTRPRSLAGAIAFRI